jgi:hypothetical protein
VADLTVQEEVIDDAIAAVAVVRQHPRTARLPAFDITSWIKRVAAGRSH